MSRSDASFATIRRSPNLSGSNINKITIPKFTICSLVTNIQVSFSNNTEKVGFSGETANKTQKNEKILKLGVTNPLL